MNARLAVLGVGAQRHLPALPGARVQSALLQRHRHQAGRDLFAGRNHGIMFARIVMRRDGAAIADQLIGHARHGRNDDGDLVAASHFLRDLGGGVLDAFDIADGGAAEFHDKEGHRKKGLGVRV